ncbi:MAG TPA: tetratricopeptide repeat protein [Elusimicrobiota bacterium]|nr:tetratricopeptide repeat protein [Elusimicrobiota bacterium]
MNQNKPQFPAWLPLVFIIALTALVMSPCLDNGFTNWDDNKVLMKNGLIRDLSPAGIKRIFSSFNLGHYNPLVVLSYAVEYRLWGLNPQGYHATNLFLHLVNVGLVFWLVSLSGGPMWVGMVVGLLFGIHPLHVESVAWVTERKDVLYALFYLGGLISYLQYVRTGSRKKYWLCVGLFVSSMLSKAMAVTFPAVLLLVDWAEGRRWERRVFLEKIGFFLVAGLIGSLVLFAHQEEGVQQVSFLKKVFYPSYILLFQLWKTVWPTKLSIIYTSPFRTSPFFTGVFYASPLLLAGLGWGIYRINKYLGGRLWGLWFYLLTSLPVLQLLSLPEKSITNDRYSYVPSIGLFLLACEWGILFCRRFPWAFNVLVPALVGTVMMFGVAAHHRCAVWKDSITLWTDVILHYPEAKDAYYNRGVAYDDVRMMQQAYEDYTMAIKIDPEHAKAYVNRGVLLMNNKEYDRALADFDRCLAISPDGAVAYNNRGNTLRLMGRLAEAETDLRKAIALNPDIAPSYFNLALVRYAQKDYEESWKWMLEAKQRGYPRAVQLERLLMGHRRRGS